MRQHYDDAMAHAGAPDFATRSMIAKALHPDPRPTEAQRAEAYKALTALWSN